MIQYLLGRPLPVKHQQLGQLILRQLQPHLQTASVLPDSDRQPLPSDFATAFFCVSSLPKTTKLLVWILGKLDY